MLLWLIGQSSFTFSKLRFPNSHTSCSRTFTPIPLLPKIAMAVLRYVLKKVI